MLMRGSLGIGNDRRLMSTREYEEYMRWKRGDGGGGLREGRLGGGSRGGDLGVLGGGQRLPLPPLALPLTIASP